MNDFQNLGDLQPADMGALTTQQRLQLELQLARIRREQADAQITALTEQFIRELDLETTLFHVTIHDMWSNCGPMYGKGDEADVTRRGLKEAIKAAEGDNPRTDNVLSYYVTARTDAGDFAIPEKMWLPFSKQTAKTLRRYK